MKQLTEHAYETSESIARQVLTDIYQPQDLKYCTYKIKSKSWQIIQPKQNQSGSYRLIGSTKRKA